MTRTEPFRVGDWLAEPELDRISRGAERVQLRSQLMEMLVYLAGRRGQVVSAEDLLNALWAGKVVTTGTVYNCVAELRQSLASKGGGSPYIETVPKRGYRLVAPVSALETRSATQGRRSGRWLAAAAAAALVASAFWRISTIPTDDAPIRPRSIAVLPFVDMSDTQDQRFFGEGLSEEILNLLSQSPELRVIARTSAFSVADRASDIATIAGQLDVAYVLEGSVRRSGDRLRITAQLVDASDSSHLWSQSYDRRVIDVLEVQLDVANAVADALEAVLQGDRYQRGTDPEAHILLLQARSLLHTLAVEDTALAVGLLEKAIEIDPSNADAYLQLARAELNSGRHLDSTVERTWLKSKAFADAALAIDPNHAAANAWQGWFETHYNHDFMRAARFYERAMQLDPTNLETVRLVINANIIFGSLDDAVRLAQYLVARDPLCLSCFYNLHLATYLSGDYEKAEEAVRRAMLLNSEYDGYYADLGRVLLATGDPIAALETFERMDDGSPWKLHGRAIALYRIGRLDEFEPTFQNLKEEWREAYPASVAMVQAEIGDIEGAFSSLNRHAEIEPWARGINYRSEFYENLRDDPRWKLYLEKLGLSKEQRADINFRVTLPN